jgi:hypothetical protein
MVVLAHLVPVGWRHLVAIVATLLAATLTSWLWPSGAPAIWLVAALGGVAGGLFWDLAARRGLSNAPEQTRLNVVVAFLGLAFAAVPLAMLACLVAPASPAVIGVVALPMISGPLIEWLAGERYSWRQRLFATIAFASSLVPLCLIAVNGRTS